ERSLSMGTGETLSCPGLKAPSPSTTTRPSSVDPVDVRIARSVTLTPLTVTNCVDDSPSFHPADRCRDAWRTYSPGETLGNSNQPSGSILAPIDIVTIAPARRLGVRAIPPVIG